ncbi:threonine deaminase [Microbotryomycetes sp. JL201]|nr:threonine deaminase [Microbotryomycetes sp. JL201]
MTHMAPSVTGLIAETENAKPAINNGQAHAMHPKLRQSTTPTKAADGTQRGTILLPDGTRIDRPVFEPNTQQYTRVPPHLMQADGTPNYLTMSLTSNVYSILPASGTPLTPAVSLSNRLGAQVLFKREDLTPVFSFKIRGAYNMMSQLTEEERWRGVVACSAGQFALAKGARTTRPADISSGNHLSTKGNHAQGVAISGRELGIACTIVMPLNTPSIKYTNVDRLGAKVVLHGADFDEAKRECARLAKVHGLTIIPPFDDPYVIAGQGTCGVEMLRQTDVSKLDAVFVPVGGGGFLAGVAAYVKAVAPPHVKVIGVETYDADCLAQTLRAGQRITLTEVGLFADGTAVRQMGEETVRLCAQLVDEIVLVSNDELCAAIKDVFEGMKKYIVQNNLVGKGRRFISIVSGANLNFSRLRFISDRAELGEGKEAMLRVIIPEQQGAFLALHSVIHPRAVTEFVYRYSSPKRAFIFLSFYLSTPRVAPVVPQSTAGNSPTTSGASTPIPTPHQLRQQELSTIMTTLSNKGMSPLDISDNEMAKSHARYLVGGRKTVENERVFRFEFPERPGALRKFLEEVEKMKFNISLFHYRNQGGDVGKILAGIQVDPTRSKEFDQGLENLGYPFVEETNNQVYRDFLDEDGDE